MFGLRNMQQNVYKLQYYTLYRYILEIRLVLILLEFLSNEYNMLNELTRLSVKILGSAGLYTRHVTYAFFEMLIFEESSYLI